MALRLKDEACGRYRKSRLRNLLVIGQVAVCLILLTAAGLCLRSLLNARSVDPGFRIDHRLTVALDLRILGYSESGSQAFYQRLLDRVGALPGVSSVSVASYLPLGFTRQTTGVLIDDVQPPLGEQGFPLGLMTVGPNYFQTMGIPVLRGREFSPRDREETQSVIIINEAMAHRFWSGQNPVGQRVTFAFGGRPGFEVVGVVKTGKYRSLQEDSEPFMYRPFFQSPTPRATLILQSLSDPMARPQSAYSARRNTQGIYDHSAVPNSRFRHAAGSIWRTGPGPCCSGHLRGDGVFSQPADA